MVAISISDEDGGILRDVLESKLVDLRREISHTDSPRFRETLYKLEAVLRRTIDQLPSDIPADAPRELPRSDGR